MATHWPNSDMHRQWFAEGMRAIPEDYSVNMKTLTWILGMTVYAALSAATWAVAPAQEPTFKIGDRAPALEPVTWLQGKPVTKYIRGRVYVVEFWATWCPPCMKAIPRLSALQREYADKLTVVAVNVDGLLGHEAEVGAVRDFMKKKGKEMAYSVAMEDLTKKTMSNTWIAASGSLGIPTACIIDQQGKLAWVGYPDIVQRYPFDQALEDTLAGKIDLARSRDLQSSTSRETAKFKGPEAQGQKD
jgi:thiol-disulfide isomerase/thioredoxin